MLILPMEILDMLNKNHNCYRNYSSMKSPMILGRSIDFLLILAEQGSYQPSTRIYHSSQGSIQDNHKRSPTYLHTNQVLSKQPVPRESNPPTIHLHVL